MDINNLPPLESFHHKVDLQLRFNDIDILGHLNNTVYFSLYDTGKSYFLREVMGGKINWQKVETVIANIDCAYVAPIFFGEKIAVYTRCKSVSNKSFILQQVLIETETGQLKSACEVVMVSYDPVKKVSTPLSDRYREALEKDMAQ